MADHELSLKIFSCFISFLKAEDLRSRWRMSLEVRRFHG